MGIRAFSISGGSRAVWKGIQRVEYGSSSNDAKTLEINGIKEDIQTIPDSKEITSSK